MRRPIQLLKRSLLAGLLLAALVPAMAQTQASDRAVPERDGTMKLLRIGVPGSMYAHVVNGKPQGAIIELTVMVFEELGYTARLVVMPVNEILSGLRNGSLEAGAGLVLRGRPQEGIAFSGPVIREFSLPITRKGEQVQITSLKGLHGKKVGARVGFSYPGLDDKPQITLVRKRKDAEMLRDLILGSLDMALIGSVSDVFEFRSEGVRTEIDLPTYAVSYVDLGCSVSSKSLPLEVIDKFNTRLSAMLNEPLWKEILSRNGLEDLVRDWPLIKE
jgi:ABC-type amino acid transport substrate-binding protein